MANSTGGPGQADRNICDRDRPGPLRIFHAFEQLECQRLRVIEGLIEVQHRPGRHTRRCEHFQRIVGQLFCAPLAHPLAEFVATITSTLIRLQARIVQPFLRAY